MTQQPAVERPLNAQRLFERLFWSVYPPELQQALAELRTQPQPACHQPEALALIDDIADTFKHLAPSLLDLPEEALDDSDASVHILGAALTRERRDQLMSQTAVGEPDFPLLGMLMIHGTLYVGRCIARNHGGQWVLRRPLWESAVRLRSSLGEGDLAVFQWWIKSLSDEEIDRLPLGARYRNYVEIPCFEAEKLPVIAPPDRQIPRLQAPKFEKLFRHLKAHAPEIKGPGDNFPSPERFAEMDFQWLDFVWVGNGRMLIMHGPAKRQGAHLFWMDAKGFVKSAFYPSDDVPSHRIRLDGDKIRVIVSIENVTRFHDMPWWGL